MIWGSTAHGDERDILDNRRGGELAINPCYLGTENHSRDKKLRLIYPMQKQFEKEKHIIILNETMATVSNRAQSVQY